MAPRLLSLLTSIETALAHRGAAAVKDLPQRTISFHKGIAQITFADGSGSIALQNFTLTDGALCVKAAITWTGSTATASHSIYPNEGFNWMDAADKIAALWMQGLPASAKDDREMISESLAAAG